MKRSLFQNLRTLFAVALLIPGLLNAEEQKTKTSGPNASASAPAPMAAHQTGGFVSAGVFMNDMNGNPQKYAEYESLRQGVRPIGEIGMWGISRGIAWDFHAERGVDPNDQSYEGHIDLLRYLQSEFRLSRLRHRLDNDPVSNLDAAKANVVVRHDNQDVNAKYCPYYQDMEIRNRLVVPILPQVTFNLDYRSQGRKGATQARAISKCANCHISTGIRPMDQEINELRAGAEIRLGPAFVKYQYTDRTSKDSAPIITHTYDRALHPLTASPQFYNRVQYDELDGPLPIAVVPHFSKFQHEVRAKLDLKEMGELQGVFVNSRSNNDDLGFGTDTRVANGVYTYSFKEKLWVTLQARNVDIDSDTWFIDVRETIAPAGTPQAGKTYSEAYPEFGSPDYFATSSLAREVFTGSADARLVLPAKTVARFSYVYENVNRTHFDVDESTTQKIKLAVNTAPFKSLKVRAGYTFAHTKDPFVNSKAALETVVQPYVSPGNPPSPLLGTQYFQLWATRQADLTALPTRTYDSFADVTWAPTANAALSFHLRSNKQSNHALNYGPWTDSDLSPSGEIWLAPHPRLDLTVNYAYHQRRTETLFVIPVFDG